MNRHTSKIGKRRVILQPHFIKRWGQRINSHDAPGKIRNICQSALINKELTLLGIGKRSRKCITRWRLWAAGRCV